MTGPISNEGLAQLQAVPKDPLKSRRDRLVVAQGDLATCETRIGEVLAKIAKVEALAASEIADLEGDLAVLQLERRNLAEELGRQRGYMEARRLNGAGR